MSAAKWGGATWPATCSAPAAYAARGAGGSQAGAGALADHGTLELGKGPDHLHHHPPRGRGGVDRLREASETRARGCDPLHDMQHVLGLVYSKVRKTTCQWRK